MNTFAMGLPDNSTLRPFAVSHACQSPLPKLTEKLYEVRPWTDANAVAESRRFLDSCDFTYDTRERVRLVIEEKIENNVKKVQ